ncbi:AbrB/MazE/SpoVT family DNA-binding domain-containing protein [Agrobacterium vitis]|uniref:AbrB/MazE/SpoVT family DNA-binding domain-containing protein n=1 Tax=Allorhizobium ampelinum TaxID=3025782 RepID=UPI001F1BAEBE|nr:AbrB/MazE/SpoVT family DNA-binding domain-containing protein [Allorhizobium ampelinum]MCF1462842.1 AbrB/MazE/SpoVT family DNA-binding domain-containing protein [Allorhizobium ampelinum]
MAIYDSTITSKGQTTIPAEIRDMLGLKPGDKVRYVTQGNRVYLRVKNGNAMQLAGLLHDPSRPPMSLEEMDAAIGESLVEDDRRITRDWHRHKRASEVSSGG